MDVEQVAEGLWRWTARHPDWAPDGGWEPEVSCVYYEADDAVVLVDPLVPTESDQRERFLRALDRDVERARRPVAVVLTIFWHERSAGELVERYGGTLWAHVSALPRIEAAVSNPFRPGDPLPGGIEAIDAGREDETIIWIPRHRALVVGDALLGDGEGGIRIPPDDWVDDEIGPEEHRRTLRPLLELPVERVLLAHGEPVLSRAHAALAEALSSTP